MFHYQIAFPVYEHESHNTKMSALYQCLSPHKKYNGQLLMKYTYFESAEVIKEASKGKKDEKIMAIEEGT